MFYLKIRITTLNRDIQTTVYISESFTLSTYLFEFYVYIFRLRLINSYLFSNTQENLKCFLEYNVP